MPITKRQFELEIDQKTEEWMKSIHAFLAQHKDEAFTEHEIRQQFRPAVGVFAILPEEEADFHLGLEKLVGLGAVGKAIIRGSAYYAYRADFPNIDGR